MAEDPSMISEQRTLVAGATSEVSSGALTDGEKKEQTKEKAFIQELAFVERPTFKVIVSIIVFSNIMELAAQTDFPELEVWTTLDNVYLAFFILEVSAQIGYKGVWFFVGKDRWWSMLDITLIILGILDLWIIPPLAGRHSDVVERLRLFRLLRAFRIFKQLPKLRAFLAALVSMLNALTKVFLVLFLTLFASALFLTHLVQRDGLLEAPAGGRLGPEDKDSAKAHFSDVRMSLFTLFRVVTQDNWNDLAGPLDTADPHLRLFFIAFIAFASWTLISVLTGVASDEMIGATSTRKEEERMAQERRHKAFIEFLRKSFYDADEDGNGVLDKDEFESLMQGPSMQETMKKLGLEMTLEELSKAWSMLDVDGQGELTIDDFVEGLAYLQETLSVKHIISIDYSVKRTSVRLEKCLDKLLDELVQVGMQNELIGSFLANQDDNRAKLMEQFHVWRVWAMLAAPDTVSSKRSAQGIQCLRRCMPARTQALTPLQDARNAKRITNECKDACANRTGDDGAVLPSD